MDTVETGEAMLVNKIRHPLAALSSELEASLGKQGISPKKPNVMGSLGHRAYPEDSQRLVSGVAENRVGLKVGAESSRESVNRRTVASK